MQIFSEDSGTFVGSCRNSGKRPESADGRNHKKQFIEKKLPRISAKLFGTDEQQYAEIWEEIKEIVDLGETVSSKRVQEKLSRKKENDESCHKYACI